MTDERFRENPPVHRLYRLLAVPLFVAALAYPRATLGQQTNPTHHPDARATTSTPQAPSLADDAPRQPRLEATSESSSETPAPAGLRLFAEGGLGLAVGAAGLAISQVPAILLARAGGGTFAPLLSIPLAGVGYPFATAIGIHAGGKLTKAGGTFPNALVGSLAGGFAGAVFTVGVVQPDGLLPVVLGFTLPSTAAGVLFYELDLAFGGDDQSARPATKWRPTLRLGRRGGWSTGLNLRF